MFSEGSGGTLHDISGLERHGTLTNMAPSSDWVASENGFALDFDGSNDYVSLPTAGVVLGSKFSIAFLVKTTSADTSANFFGTFDTGTTGLIGLFANLNSAAGAAAGSTLWQVRDESGGTRNVSFFGGFYDGLWHLIVCTRNGSTTSVYIDGKEQSLTIGTNTLGTGAITTEFPLTISAANNRGVIANHLASQIGLFLLYPGRNLSALEVSALNHNPFVIVEPTRKAFLFFADGGSPATVTPDVAIWQFSPQTPSIAAAVSVAVGAAVWTFAPQTPTIAAAVSVSADAAVWQWSAQTPTISAAVTVSADPAEWVWTVPQATVSAAVTVTPSPAVVTFTANTPTISSAVSVTADAAAWTFIVPAVDVANGQIQAGVAVMQFTVPTAIAFVMPTTNTASDLPRPLKAHFVAQRLDASFEKQTLAAEFEKQTLTAGFYRE